MVFCCIFPNYILIYFIYDFDCKNRSKIKGQDNLHIFRRLIMFDKIKEIIVEQLNIDDSDFINLDTNLQEDLNADSLDAVEIIMNIEEEFDIKVDDDELENIKTIGDIVKYIENNK